MATDEHQEGRVGKILHAFLQLQSNENTIRAYATDLQGFFQMVGYMPIDRITEGDIVTFRQKIAKQNRASTVLRKLIVIRKFFTFLVEKQFIAQNPVAGMKFPRVSPESRTNGLTKEQAESLLRQPDRTTLIGKRD